MRALGCLAQNGRLFMGVRVTAGFAGGAASWQQTGVITQGASSVAFGLATMPRAQW
jgi:hypothetical protein